MRTLILAALLGLAGCGGHLDTAPAAPVPDMCAAQVYADPHVKDLIMKSAGSPTFASDHTEELKYAKIDAVHRCLQLKGVLPPGGGVERPKVEG